MNTGNSKWCDCSRRMRNLLEIAPDNTQTIAQNTREQNQLNGPMFHQNSLNYFQSNKMYRLLLKGWKRWAIWNDNNMSGVRDDENVERKWITCEKKRTFALLFWSISWTKTRDANQTGKINYLLCNCQAILIGWCTFSLTTMFRYFNWLFCKLKRMMKETSSLAWNITTTNREWSQWWLRIIFLGNSIHSQIRNESFQVLSLTCEINEELFVSFNVIYFYRRKRPQRCWLWFEFSHCV